MTAPLKTCGSCFAGMFISERLPTTERAATVNVEKCDECALFEYDDDAAVAVVSVLLMTKDGQNLLTKAMRRLHKEFRGIESGDTPSAALARLWDKTS